jgi:TPR repeat protein
MTTTANPGTETPFASAGGRKIAESDDGYARYDGYEDRGSPSHHDPEATALLRRYLSEVHSFREMGNHALRDLEARLATLPSDLADDEEIERAPGPRAAHGSPLMRPSLAAGQRPEMQAPFEPRRRADPGLSQRLHELSAYLHADLSKDPPQNAHSPGLSPHAVPGSRSEPAAAPHKIPTLPVLDRAWFEERFALMRTSMDRITEQLPLQRMDALEAQFRDLMDRLAVRETARDPRPLDKSLKELAAYLADSRQWAVANEKRVKGLEDKLERLSRLVSQSHAAISATAKGLELVAQGTGDSLARRTADIVVARIGKAIDSLNPSDRLEQLGREVAHLTAQSRHLARSAEDRLEQIQIVLKEKVKPATQASAGVKPPGGRPGAPPRPKTTASEASSHDELQSYLNHPIDLDEDYDSEMIAAAQHAARLADGPAQGTSSRDGPVRYQIPYGEFLPDEGGPSSRIGLVVAIVILALAGATMLFLKWKEWTLIQPKPVAVIERPSLPVPAIAMKQSRLDPPSSQSSADAPRVTGGMTASQGNGIGTPVVTGSTPAAPRLGAKSLQLWVASNASEQGQTELPPPVVAAKAETPEASFREAAVKGDLNAQFSVGQSYLSGKDDDGILSAPDPAAGVRWIRRSAERGYAPAQYKLASLYERGHAVPRDLAEAELWYEKAASQGHVKAMHNLAVLATAQKGKPANYVTAARWFKEAAGYGLVDSEFNLGILYERGLGVARDMIEAYRWFSLASRQGDEKARQKREDVARLLTPAERQTAERLIAGWMPKQRSVEVNRVAPEMPVSEGGDNGKPEAPRSAQTTSAAVVKASWKTDLAVTNKPAGSTMIMEAQRLLRQRGYDTGPADGVAGPRTLNAVRSFQRSAGLPATGEVDEKLIVKMAFMPL